MEKIDISVIIPTYNRAGILEKTLNLYSAQTYPKNKMEVVVVNDGSDDQTENVVEEFRKKAPYPFKYIQQDKAGPASARNKGIKEARGDILMFTGDDIFPKEDLLEQHVKSIGQFPNIGILGFVEWSEDGETTDFMKFIAPNGFQFNYGGIKDPHHCGFRHYYTSNLSIKKNWFSHLLFDEEFPYGALEDTELGYRLEKRGLKIMLNTNAVGYHYHPTTFESFRHRMKCVGISATIFVQKHPEQKRLFMPVHISLARLFSRVLKILVKFKLFNKKSYWLSGMVASYIDGYREGLSTDKNANKSL